MKINNNSPIWQWYKKFFLSGANEPVIKLKSNKNADTVKISLQAKREMRNAEIDKMINSGEPMTGVSYEEFGDYYYAKHGYRLSNCDMVQEYQQAVKGDNASLKQKEWRSNPEYRIPMRIYNSPEVTADREAAIEKFRRGEDLSDWEKNVMETFTNCKIRDSIIQSANQERQVNIIQSRISNAISSAGIQLDKDTELTFEVWGRSLTVSGNASEETLKAVQKAVSEIDCSKDNSKGIGYRLQGLYYRTHNGYAQGGGVELGFLQEAEELLQDYGSGVTVFDLSLDFNGNILGLPNEMSKFIKENAIGEFGEGISEKYADNEKAIIKARYMRKAFKSTIEVIQKGNYERLKAMTCKLTYKNGILSC